LVRICRIPESSAARSVAPARPENAAARRFRVVRVRPAQNVQICITARRGGAVADPVEIDGSRIERFGQISAQNAPNVSGPFGPVALLSFGAPATALFGIYRSGT
jgi:hypothetical protein